MYESVLKYIYTSTIPLFFYNHTNINLWYIISGVGKFSTDRTEHHIQENLGCLHFLHLQQPQTGSRSGV